MQVLLLDEASSSVDPETDALIQRTIRTEFSRCTVITIAHRINTISDSDRILCMDQGVVAEFDSPARLLATPGSIYASMVAESMSASLGRSASVGSQS